MERIGSILFVLAALFCLSFSAGCAKPRFEVAVASQPNVNPDHSNRPSPVIVKIYELRNDLAFKQAEFTALFANPLQVIGADLVASDELVFIPGEARRIAYQPNPGTRFVGIVAGFRQMDRALWRVIKPVDPEEENWLAVELNDASILAIPDEEAEDWDPEKAVRQFQQQSRKPEQPAVTDSAPAAVPAQSSPSSFSTASSGGEEISARAEQEAKEIITVITQDGVVTSLGNESAGSAATPPAPAPAPAPAPGGADTSPLPSIRSL